MNKLIIPILISIILIQTPISYSPVATVLAQNTTIYSQPNITNNITINTTNNILSNNISIPELKATLWKYDMCTIGGGYFVVSCNPSSYIINNEVIRTYSQYLQINNMGILNWKKENPFKNYSNFRNNYISDNEQFNHPSYDDYWINPDYYFTRGMKGDCEDAALAVASVLNNKKIPYILVIGISTSNGKRTNDMIVEYRYNNKTYYYMPGIYHRNMHIGFIPKSIFNKNKKKWHVDFEPHFMFNNKKYKYYTQYKNEW